MTYISSKWKMTTLVCSLTLLMSGCGEESERTEIVSPAVFVAPNIDRVIVTMPGEVTRIPLYQAHKASFGDELELESVSLLAKRSDPNSLCELPKKNGLELHYTPKTQGICVYEYVIRNGETRTISKLVSLVSSNDEPRLDDMNRTIEVGQTEFIDIDVNDSEQLAIVDVLGSGVAHVEQNTIEYRASNPGMSRVIYSLTSQDGTLQLGVINISVSLVNDNNQPPEAPDVGRITVLSGETILITPKISDPDEGDDPQLISVTSLDGVAVAPAVDESNLDESYFANKSFTFSANEPGSYVVYYTVHDHNGGYNTGRATVVVEGEVGLRARDATFFRQPTDKAYDFKIDLRSFIQSSDMAKVQIVSSSFDETSADKAPEHLTEPTTENPILTYHYPGGNLKGTVLINYTVADPNTLMDARVFIAIGEDLPEITTLTTTPEVTAGATVTVESECINCDNNLTKYHWYYGSALYSENDTVTVPDGVQGESLILVATPHNSNGMAGKARSRVYSFPL